MINLVKYIDIDKITPATYNPRKIENEQIEELKKSITELGFIIPILINSKNNVIVAGHQRTKTAKLLGFKEVPAILIDSIVLGDEIKFNQIHNGIDKSLKHSQTLLKDYDKEKFIEIDNKYFTNEKGFAAIVNEICKLILKYGNVLTCIVCKNKVVYGCEYIKACKSLNIKVNAYIVPDEKFDKLVHFLNQEYGKYCYDNIERKTYVQGLAQMARTVEKTDLRQNKSILYTTMVFPYLKYKNKNTSILDFGCGMGAYINHLSKTYKNAMGIEFYNNNRKAINVTKGNKQIDKFIEYIKKYKNYDVVVCDSVLNSVDSIEAENNIIKCLNLFTNDRLFISGRTLKAVEIPKEKNGCAKKNKLTFLDENNFTSTYREGQWYFQHFNTKEDITKKLKENGFEIVNIAWDKYSRTFQIECKKVKELNKEDYIKAIDFEFDLPLPNNKSYKRNEDVKNAFNLI